MCAKPVTYVGSTVAIFLEDPAAPGTFLRPCGLTSHTVTFSKQTNEVLVPDCSDPELPAWIERGVEGLDFNVTGNGILAAEAVDAWWDAFNITESIPARIYIGKPTDIVNGRFWEGNLHITSLEIGGERGGKATASLTAVSDGELVFSTVTA